MGNPNKYLFVYGTLRQGSENESTELLSRSADRVAEGRTRGQLFLLADYPGLVPFDGEVDWVYGDVYELHSPEVTYQELDKYEGCSVDDLEPHEYHRSIIPVLLESGKWIQASAYVYARDTAGKPRIISGDFRSE